MMKLEIRKGTPADTDAYISFLADVKRQMAHQTWFYLDPPELVRSMMADGSMELWVVKDGNRIVAACDIIYPGLEAYNYGYSLGLTEEELLQVVHMDTVAVHPEYRGLGLQRKLADTVEKDLTGRGGKTLLCTVHPDNRYSLHNMLKQGYEIQKRIDIYGSERFILRKNIS